MDHQPASTENRRPTSRLRCVLLIVLPGLLGGVALALVVLRPALRQGPEDPASQVSRAAEADNALAQDHDMLSGEAAFRAGHFLEAIRRFDAAHRRHPQQPAPLVAQTRVFLALKQGQNAISVARQACSVAADDTTCYVLLGQALEAAGDSEKAAEAYARAQNLDPKDPNPPYHLGRLAQARLQTEIAVGYYRQALAADPDFTPAASDLAGQLREAGRFDEAEQLLTAALERKPEETGQSLNFAQRTWLRLNLAHTYLRKGDAAKAVKEFQLVLSRVPKMPEPHYDLGCALELLGRDAEAADAFERAVTYDPHLSQAWYALAQLRKRRGEAHEAEQAFTKFSEARELASQISDLERRIRLNPDDVDALVELGKAQLLRDKPADASHSFWRAIQVDADHEQARGLLQQAANEVGRKRREQHGAPSSFGAAR